MSGVLTGFTAAIGGIAFVTLLLLGGAYRGGEGATFRDRIFSSPGLSPLLIIHYFLPYALIVLAIFMDVMSMLPQATIGLGFAILALVVNYMIGGDPSLLPSDLCEIPGLKGMASYFLPQSLLFVTTIVTYIASFVTFSITQNAVGVVTSTQTVSLESITPSPMTRVGASWGLAGAVILFQAIGLATTPGCLTNMKWTNFSNTPMPAAVSILLAILVGAGLGIGTGYGFSTMSVTQPSYTISGNSPNGYKATQPGFVRERFQLGSGLGEIPTPSQGGEAPVDIAKSSGAVTPGESSDQFVCEAYKNGQLVTSTLVG